LSYWFINKSELLHQVGLTNHCTLAQKCDSFHILECLPIGELQIGNCECFYQFSTPGEYIPMPQLLTECSEALENL